MKIENPPHKSFSPPLASGISNIPVISGIDIGLQIPFTQQPQGVPLISGRIGIPGRRENRAHKRHIDKAIRQIRKKSRRLSERTTDRLSNRIAHNFNEMSPDEINLHCCVVLGEFLEKNPDIQLNHSKHRGLREALGSQEVRRTLVKIGSIFTSIPGYNWELNFTPHPLSIVPINSDFHNAELAHIAIESHRRSAYDLQKARGKRRIIIIIYRRFNLSPIFSGIPFLNPYRFYSTIGGCYGIAFLFCSSSSINSISSNVVRVLLHRIRYIPEPGEGNISETVRPTKPTQQTSLTDFNFGITQFYDRPKFIPPSEFVDLVDFFKNYSMTDNNSYLAGSEMGSPTPVEKSHQKQHQQDGRLVNASNKAVLKPKHSSFQKAKARKVTSTKVKVKKNISRQMEIEPPTEEEFCRQNETDILLSQIIQFERELGGCQPGLLDLLCHFSREQIDSVWDQLIWLYPDLMSKGTTTIPQMGLTKVV